MLLANGLPTNYAACWLKSEPPLQAVPRRLPHLLLILCLGLSACGDPEREIRLKWREEEVNAKEAALMQREAIVVKDKQIIEGQRLDIVSREKNVEVLKKQLQEELDKAKKLRREIELKELRGPLPRLTAERVLIIDAESNEVIYEKNATLRGAVASTTKLLTALLIVEAGELDKMVTVEKSDTECAPVKLGLKAGEQYSRRQLLTAVMVKSSNDIAQALARDNAGSVEAFVEKMNQKCRQLGLTDSHFMNPHGLPEQGEEQPYSTARDMASIARACDKKPEIREIVRLQSYKFKWNSGKVSELTNTNRVLRSVSYCDGMKTGYTGAAGYCLVASGSRNGRRRIVVVLNGTESGVWRDAQNLLDWGLKA